MALARMRLSIGGVSRVWRSHVDSGRPSLLRRFSSAATAMQDDDDNIDQYPKPKLPTQPRVYEKKVDELGRAYGTGGRKCAVARVWVYPGTGRITVNSMTLIEYFPRIKHCEDIIEPFHYTESSCDFDVYATVKGGGKSGQAGAIRLGIARALQNFNPSFRPKLKERKLLTRDARIVERKKPGRKKARKRKQWTKR